MPDRRLTFTTLLDIKRRRERRIRRDIAGLEQQWQALEARKQALQQEQQALRATWRQCSSNEQVLTPQEWKLLRAQLGNFYQQDHFLQGQIEALASGFSLLQEQKDQQQQLLRQNLLEQEKLTLLME